MVINRVIPALDRLSLLRRLRTAGTYTPALVLSALDQVGDRVEDRRGRGYDYLVKPFALE